MAETLDTLAMEYARSLLDIPDAQEGMYCVSKVEETTMLTKIFKIVLTEDYGAVLDMEKEQMTLSNGSVFTWDTC